MEGCRAQELAAAAGRQGGRVCAQGKPDCSRGLLVRVFLASSSVDRHYARTFPRYLPRKAGTCPDCTLMPISGSVDNTTTLTLTLTQNTYQTHIVVESPWSKRNAPHNWIIMIATFSRHIHCAWGFTRIRCRANIFCGRKLFFLRGTCCRQKNRIKKPTNLCNGSPVRTGPSNYSQLLFSTLNETAEYLTVCCQLERKMRRRP